VTIMSSAARPVDLAALLRAIDEARRDRGLSWGDLSREVGVAASTMRRLGHAADAEADGVLALIGWLGVEPERFIRSTSVAGERLQPRRDGMVRADPDALRALGAVVSNRTTIQHLATIAQSTGRTVASLTRWSEI
jgi:hypothetical protein